MKKIGLLAVAVLISAVTFAQTSTPATAPASTTLSGNKSRRLKPK